jgi:hypothetical protein
MLGVTENFTVHIFFYHTLKMKEIYGSGIATKDSPLSLNLLCNMWLLAAQNKSSIMHYTAVCTASKQNCVT